MSESSSINLSFAIDFYSPFHALTGRAARGLDGVLDADAPLPASAVKGTMRASARALGFPDRLIRATFGHERSSSRWSWLTPTLTGLDRHGVLSRVAIDPETGTVRPDHLQATEIRYPTGGTFDISLRSRHGLDEVDIAQQVILLAASACATKAMGAHRRRGLGWVGILPTEETRQLLNVQTQIISAGTSDWLDGVESLLAASEGKQS